MSLIYFFNCNLVLTQKVRLILEKLFALARFILYVLISVQSS